MKLKTFLETVYDGEEHGWETEFRWIEEHSKVDLDELLEDVCENGIRTPVQVGPDNRLWDGHHRVWAAHKIGFQFIPVEWVEE